MSVNSCTKVMTDGEKTLNFLVKNANDDLS